MIRSAKNQVHLRLAARLAHGERELLRQEAAVLATVLHHPGPASQSELEAIMAERLGMSRSQSSPLPMLENVKRGNANWAVVNSAPSSTSSVARWSRSARR